VIFGRRISALGFGMILDFWLGLSFHCVFFGWFCLSFADWFDKVSAGNKGYHSAGTSVPRL